MDNIELIYRKDVELQSYEYAEITDLTADLYYKRNTWDITIKIFIDIGPRGQIYNSTLKACLVVQESCNTVVVAFPPNSQSTNASVVLSISDVGLRYHPKYYPKLETLIPNIFRTTSRDGGLMAMESSQFILYQWNYRLR